MANKSVSKRHYGWCLSRACIHDTLMMKRDHLLNKPGLGYALYSTTIMALRETQLAPYDEPMVAGRYLAKQELKRMPHDVVIVVENGVVVKVLSNNPMEKVYIADYDSENYDDREEAENRASMSDMHIVSY